MRVVALHQENMMTIERHLKSEQLVDLVEYIDMMGYGEGVYKTGPAMVSLPPDQFLADEIDFKAYAPISVEVELEENPFDWQAILDIPESVTETVRFGDEINDAYQKIIDFLKEKNLPIPERFFMVFTPIYADYWVDFIFPIKPIEEK